MGLLGPNNGTAFANDGTVGTIAISTPTNAQLSDNVYCTSVLLLGQVTNYLKATSFGFAIPTDATINGIVVEIEKSTTLATSIIDNSVKIVKGNSITGTELASASQWGTADAYATYGTATELWGTTWTPADINLGNFGIVISGVASVAATAQIDHVRISVYYTGSNKAGNLAENFRAGSGMSVSG